MHRGLISGFKSSFDSFWAAVAVIAVSSMFYLVLTLSSFPNYSLEMLNASILYLDEAFLALNWNVFNTAGYAGIFLSVVYSVFSGVLLVNLYQSLKINGISNIKKSGGMFPAFLAGGCAGCGAGILGFFGLLGIASALPFQGNGLKVGSIALMAVAISSIGNPEKCSID
ncbi:hypothetical protein [Candidatus Nanohalovita haloferacivicina]|jgi:hypothetical protein|uniref:hypothetical protein n=1 Tax=Candidatus Nanohalovita haloferacivicina TaxID=2978046 RepID=UPI00325FCBFF|nr:putative membrane protein [Candidatus Nanohalobia archaeon BNXNv]